MTFAMLEEIAFGFLGLRPDQLYKYTQREFFHMLNGMRERRQSDFREQIENTRFLAWLILRSFASGRIEPEDVFRFPWEKPKPVKLMSPERVKWYEEIIKKEENGRSNSV